MVTVQEERGGKPGDRQFTIGLGLLLWAGPVAVDHGANEERFHVVRVQLQRLVEIGQGQIELASGSEQFGPPEKPLRLPRIDFCRRCGVLQGALQGLQLDV